ncbi:probable 2-hydroxyacyl-CoA lyase at C-terminar half [Coccomyxa sp. Obi]|nr:probable 2-hydroxyacyl-CoA lyase at C-terminar half [Coccomyxa sp. Obi]
MTGASTLLDALGGLPDAVAIFCAGGGPRLTRDHLRKEVIRVAVALRKSGIRPGDAVSIADTNTVDFVVAFLGVTCARAVAAPLNSNYTEDEFQFYMRDAASKLLLVPVSGNKAAERAASSLNIPTATVSVSWTDGGLSTLLSGKSGDVSFEAQGAKTDLEDPPHGDDVALFLHTSGTTSRPKGVPLTHANLAASLANIVATYELTPHDRSLLVMPLFHVHGLMAGLLAPLLAGSAVILPAGGKFSAGTFWNDAVEFGATFYTAVPTMHQILLARAEKDYPAQSPPPLRFIRSCSSSLAAPTLHKLEAIFHVPVLEAYAMTEASHQMTSNPLPKNGPHKAGTVGRAQGSVQVTILDEQNKQLPVGKVGEVCIRGPNVTKGYLNNPKANEEAYAGGWFHTGDQGFLDEEGFLTLTGRLKELINRGGEKISPLEVDSALLGHPLVNEAVSFGAPDEKYGEVVAAAVVLSKPADDAAAVIADIRKFAATKLAKFKVPEQIVITDKLPKGATGKIQRRNMVGHFMGDKGKKAAGGIERRDTASGSSSSSTADESANGYTVVARALAQLGIRFMYGVIGIPVTELASAAQAAGIRFVGFRNEQAAGYAAAAAGFLTGVPGVLLTVSGPGAVHGIAGLSHAQVNTWPMLMISGSAEQGEVGKGAFQELDQVAAVTQFTKYAGRARCVRDIAPVMTAAVKAAVAGRPGAVYVDVPSDILMAPASPSEVPDAISHPVGFSLAERPRAADRDIRQAVTLLQQARRPLVVIGKGAAYSQADAALRSFVAAAQLPFLATAMGRGVVPDNAPGNCNAARSLALAHADVAIIFGARLNWQLHFGEPPKWAPGVRFILVDVEPSQRDADKAEVVLRGDAAAVAEQLQSAIGALDSAHIQAWRDQLTHKAEAAKAKLEVRLSADAFPLDYSTTLRVIRDALLAVSPAPIVISEGANTMDNARVILEPAVEGRLRLDAATWGTMGVGLGYAVAAATTRPGRLVVAVEGDSAFGFSGMECETIVRYKLPVVIIVLNNGGIYGGDRRPSALQQAAASGATHAGFASDPVPTAFVPDARYEAIMDAFGGDAFSVNSSAQLAAACRICFAAMRPALINVTLDPFAGVESGNVHAFNAPKSKV